MLEWIYNGNYECGAYTPFGWCYVWRNFPTGDIVLTMFGRKIKKRFGSIDEAKEYAVKYYKDNLNKTLQRL